MTALVGVLEKDADKRRLIQDMIMNKNREVEQVGFVGFDGGSPALLMTGGEFCGNAARSAAWHFLDGKPGEISIRVSGASKPIKAGFSDDLGAWAEMPLDGCSVRSAGDGMVWVDMEGISHLVLTADASAKYLKNCIGINKNENENEIDIVDKVYKVDEEQLLRHAGKLLNSHPSSANACGVIFTGSALPCEANRNTKEHKLRIYPCVFVATAGTTFYETACGSGSAAVAIAEGVKSGRSLTLGLLQPSGMTIEATVEISRYPITLPTRALISGPIEVNCNTYHLDTV